MGQPAEFNSNGNFVVGSNRNPSKSRITVDFTADNDEGIALDVGPTPHQTSERAAIRLGDWVFGQDPGKTGFKTIGAVDVSGNFIAMPYVLARSAIPIIDVSTGSMANNGVISALTALPATYTSCYLVLPANAIAAGSAAGIYFAQMSGVSGGTVFNNTYTSGIPTIPTSPTPFVTTGPGAFTGNTSLDTIITITLPGGSMGVNGVLEAFAQWSFTNNINNKTPHLTFGGSDFFAASITSAPSYDQRATVRNRGAAAVQVGSAASGYQGGGFGTASAALNFLTVNSAADVTLNIKIQKATATDNAVLEAFEFVVIPG